jgi:hypothetical protein
VPQRPRLRLREQLVTPIERRKQRLVPRQRRSRAAGQQAKAIVQARGDLLQPKGCDTSRREFDSERDAVESTRNRSEQLKITPARREVSVQRLCLGDQELHCTPSKDILISVSVLPRNIERGNTIDIFAVDPKHLSTRRENRRVGTGSNQCLCQSRSPVDEMLAIVQHEQKPSFSDLPRNGFEGNLIAALLEAEHSGNRKRHQCGVRQGGQFDEQAVAPEAREQIAGDRLREHSLADTAGPGHGDDPIDR